jgi:hypothetical protein
LAAVAAPATVHSIGITHAYKEARKYSLLSRVLGLWRVDSACWLGRLINAFGASPPKNKPEDDCSAGARRLAHRVVLLEYVTICLTVSTLVISAYALSGSARNPHKIHRYE